MTLQERINKACQILQQKDEDIEKAIQILKNEKPEPTKQYWRCKCGRMTSNMNNTTLCLKCNCTTRYKLEEK